MAQSGTPPPSVPGPYVPGPYVPGGYYPGDPYGGLSEPTFDWRQYLMVLRRRMWPALTMFVLCAVAGVVHGYTRVPVYEARAQVVVERDRPNITGLSDPLSQGGVVDTDIETQLSVLQSRSLARRTLRSLGVLPGTVTFGTTAAFDDTGPVDGFLAGLRAVPAPKSRLINVYYQSTDPAITAKYANAVVDEFISQNLQTKVSSSKELSQWLNDRLTSQKEALTKADQQLQGYRDRNGVVSTKEQTNLLTQKLSDLTTTYIKAQAERLGQEAVITQIDAITRDKGSLEDSPAIARHPQVVQLRNELSGAERNQAQLALNTGDRNPLLIKAREAVKSADARLQAEMVRVAEQVRRDYLAAQETETKLKQAWEAQRREAFALNRSDIDLAIYTRDADSSRQIYDKLLQQMNEFAVTREDRFSKITRVDSAEVPRAPLGTAAMNDIRYGLAGGVLLGILVAFGLERADNRVKTPKQLKDLGLAILGLVPRVVAANAAAGPLLSRKTPPAFNEAFRGIRTNVRLSIAVEGMRSVVVTSPRAGDGKTSVVGNLGVALALADQRVLLIDADMRRPRLHKVFDLPQQPGLSDLLVGQATAAEAVRRLDIPNLHVLTCGTTPPNPSELLESRRFAEFLDRLQKHFDWVILDAPPILPVTDASVLSGKVNGVIFVVSAEQTPLPALRGALEQLGKTQAHVLGAVLNGVDMERRGYYYTEYYNRDTAKYYAKSAV